MHVRIACGFLSALAILTFVWTQAEAQDRLCRLNNEPWLACAAPAGPASGSTCRCPTEAQTSHDTSGRVSTAQPDELAYLVTSSSTKLSLGLDSLSGPIIILISRRIAESHGPYTDPHDQHLAELYDFLHGFQNLQPLRPLPRPRQ